MAEKDDSRELVLAPNESCCILDRTNGNVFLYVGPKQDSLAPSVQPVLFNEKTKVFDRVDLARAIQRVTIAPEGWYAVLKNPAKNPQQAHPAAGNKAAMPDLDTGRKIIIPGPTSFALWPGQMCKVLPGHRLRSNQYLIVRVYDQTAARENWKNATIEKAESAARGGDVVDANKLTTGQLNVIRGTETSFFIPPTGIEVVSYKDDAGEEKLVRDAVSLERLDFALLLDESGSKRYEVGPATVFPEPTEVFVTKTDEAGKTTRKFRCIELNETSGIYVKVTADYKDDKTGAEHKAGDELFITGRDEKLYFPREEHAIVRYGDQEVHYATAIPAGEGRYVLDRLKGEVRTVKGPAMYLPDPRTEVFVRRVLDQKMCELLYPGNAEALAHNVSLGAAIAAEEKAAGGPLTRTSALRGGQALLGSMSYGAAAAAEGSAMDALYLQAQSLSNSLEDRGLAQVAAKGFTGDGFDRKGRYTEPRTVTLNTKYQGVITTDIWTGYAIKLVKRSGEQRVEVGPKSVMFEYDEVPQVLKLSTGKPKNADSLYKTAYLQVRGNKISDVLDVETGDYCKLQLKLSYRVDFEGDPVHWFEVENYVKLLCDNMRSRFKAAVKKLGVEEFYRSAVEHVRDVALGPKPEAGGQRLGTSFAENGMRIYDVEVLEVKFLDQAVEQLLVKAQRESITQALEIGAQRRSLEFTRESSTISQEIQRTKAQAGLATLQLEEQSIEAQMHRDIVLVHAKATTEAEALTARLAGENGAGQVQQLSLARERAAAEQVLGFEKERQAMRLRDLEAEIEAVVKKAQAISPDLVAAIGSFGERALIEKLAESMSPLAIIGGTSVTDVVKKLLDGTKLGRLLEAGPSNGSASTKALPAQ